MKVHYLLNLNFLGGISVDLSIGSIKRRARGQLSGTGSNYFFIVLVIMAILIVSYFLEVFGSLLMLLLSGPILLGLSIFSINIVRSQRVHESKGKTGMFLSFTDMSYQINAVKNPNNHSTKLSTVFYGFKYFIKALGLYLWITLITLVWSLLLIVPGIVKLLGMSMSFFIMADRPGSMSITNAVRISEKIMQGHKMKFFLLNLSFIGWTIFSIMSFGLGLFVTIPFLTASYAVFYDELKEYSIKNGIITEDEIGTTKIWDY